MKLEIIKKITTSIGIILAGIVLGYLLMTLAYCVDIPGDRYEETMRILSEEGYHPRELLMTGKSDYYAENYPDILDIGTDEYIFKYTLENLPESSFQRALVKDYGRYWHGYVAFLRPLALFFDLDEIRFINFGIQLLLFLLLLYLIHTKIKRKRYIIAALGIYLFMGPSSLSCNMQYSSIYYVAVISGIATIGLKNYFDKNNRYIYLFLITGMATAYVDLLTYPLLAWGVPAAIFIALYGNEARRECKNWLRKVIELAASAIMWILGYSTMWAGKWTLGKTLSDIDVWFQATHEAKATLGTNEPHFFVRLESFLINWTHLTYKPFVVIFAVAFLIWIIVIVKKGMVKDFRIPAFAVMFLSTPVWYVVAYTHTRGHHIFTWRVALTTVLAAFMIACLSTDYSEDKEPIGINNRWLRISLLALCIGLGALTYRIVPAEKISSWNYDIVTNETMLPAGEENAYVMDFTPKYPYIFQVGPLLNTDETDGYAELILTDGSKVVDTQKISFAESEQGNNKDIPVRWHLKKGKQYQITISTEHLTKPVKTWVTENTERYEYSGEEAMGMGYYYYGHFADAESSVFYVLSWAVVWITVVYLVLFFAGNKKASGVENHE